MTGCLLGGHWAAEPGAAQVSTHGKVLLGKVLALTKAGQQLSKSKIMSLLDETQHAAGAE